MFEKAFTGFRKELMMNPESCTCAAEMAQSATWDPAYSGLPAGATAIGNIVPNVRRLHGFGIALLLKSRVISL